MSASALPAHALAKSKPMARRQFEAARYGTLSVLSVRKVVQLEQPVARTRPPRLLSSFNWRNAAVRRTIAGGAVPERPVAQPSGTPARTVSATARPPYAETPEKVLMVRL